MLENLVKKFKAIIQQMKDKEDYYLKREMCEKAIKSGVCPNFCHHCAWNTRVIKND